MLYVTLWTAKLLQQAFAGIWYIHLIGFMRAWISVKPTKSSWSSPLLFSVSVHKKRLTSKLQIQLNMITHLPRCGVCSDIYYCDNQAWRRFNYPGAETKDINITICPNIPPGPVSRHSPQTLTCVSLLSRKLIIFLLIIWCPIKSSVHDKTLIEVS